MTPREQAVVRDLRAQVRVANERRIEVETELTDALVELAREKRTRRKAVSRATKAREDAMFLHGVVLMNDIELPERMTA